MADFRIRSVGEVADAVDVLRRALRTVSAYRRHIWSHGLDPAALASGSVDWEAVPLTDKANYYVRYPHEKLMTSENDGMVWYYFRSFGTSGHPYFWPMPKGPSMRRFDWEKTLQELFQIDRYKTLAVMGHGLGSWAAGVVTYAGLHNLAFRRPGLTALCVGNREEEIVESVLALHAAYERVLLFMAPSGIERLLEYIRSSVPRFPFAKCRFAVAAEAFDESLRDRLNRLCRTRFPEVGLACQFYGSAETGIVGDESLASIALRSLLQHCRSLRESLGINRPVPNVYHLRSVTFLENVEGEAAFTQWGAIPLVRYVLRDRIELWDWEHLRTAIADFRVPLRLRPLQKRVVQARGLPHLLAYFGRNDGIKVRNGWTLYYADCEAAMHVPELSRWGTGQFAVSSDGDVKSRVRWEIELKSGVRASVKILDLYYRALVREISRLDARFAAEYRQDYSKWETGPRSSWIFDIDLIPWPLLSQRLQGYSKRYPPKAR